MILILDADPATGPGLARLLRYNGHAAECVALAAEALALLPIRKPQALVVDLRLPQIGGLEFIRAVRADPTYADVPIIVYTGDFSAAAAEEARRAGATDVIVKGTLGIQSLLARIEKHLTDGDTSP